MKKIKIRFLPSMRLRFLLLFLLPLWGAHLLAQSGNFQHFAWTNDATSGIDTRLTYTHAAKFGWMAPSIVINEVNVNREGGPSVGRGAINQIELLVIQDGLNLSGMVLRDFTANWTNDSGTPWGYFIFKDVPLWKNLPAGTLIVLSTSNSAPQRITRDGEYLSVRLFDSNYFTWGGNFDIESRDMVMIKDGSTQPNVYRPNAGPVTGVLGSLHVVQGGRSDGDSDDPLISFVELANSAISLITVEGILASLVERWLNWDEGWGSTFDLIDGQDIRWSQIASAKLGGEDSPNYNSFNGSYAVKNSTGTLSDYNGFNDGSKVSSGVWYQHTLGQPNNTNNQAFINALRATRRGVETSIPSWDRRRGELITSVNGLSLSRFKDINPSGGNFSTVGLGGMCENNGTEVSGAASSGELSRGFLFGTGTEVLHLTGLTPGRAYVASLFSVGAGAPGTHWQTISTSSLNGAGSYRFDQNAFGPGQGIRIDIRYVAGSSGRASFQIDPENSRNSFHLYGFVNRVENLRQWINFPSLPDVVAGQTLDLAVGNIFATYQNTNNPRPGETGWFALCTADGEGTLVSSLGTGLPISLTSSDTNVATIGNAITSGGIGGAALGYWVIPRAAGTTILTATAAGNGIYGAAAPVSLTLNVRPNANAVVTLTEPTNLVYDGTGKSYGARVQSSEEFTYSYTGTGSTGYGPSTNSPTRAGTYSVTATSTNPSFPVSKTATFTIERASNSFTFDSLPVKTMGDAPFALTPVQTTGGAPITFTSSNTNVATVSGSTVTLVGAGQTVITASQSNLPGFEDYVVAPSQAQTLYVRATQTISFGALAPKVVNSGAFALTATASSGLAVSYQSSNTNVARVTGSTVTLLAPGTTVITASQEGSPTTFAAASNVSQTLTVIPQPLSAEDVSFQGPANLGYDGTAKGYTAQAGFVAKIAAGGFNSAAILKNGTVVVWGDPSYGKCDPPAGLNAVEKLSVGYSHILAMQGPNQGSSDTRSGGYKLVAWGSDSDGKVSTFQGARVLDIAAGRSHTVVQSTRATVESCGLADQGQCDFGWFDYTYAESWGATNKPYLSNGQRRRIELPKVYAGAAATYAFRPATDDNIRLWGTNAGKVEVCGKRYEVDYIPESVPENLTGVMDLAVGGTFVIALKNEYVPFHYPTNSTDVPIPDYFIKTVTAWGWMNYTMSQNAWVPSSLGTDVIAIAAGYEHALALRTNGTVVGWGGGNYYRQNSIPAGLTNVVAIASGDYHNLALKSDGTVVAWGDNGWGQTSLPASRLGVSGFTYSYTGKAGSATTYGPSTNPPTQGGSYTVTATPTDPYYSGAVSRDFTITPATLAGTSITINAPASLIYSGTPKTHTATSLGISGFAFSYSGVNATAYGPTPVAPTNVGDYQVTATSSDPSWSGSKTQAFSIAPASLGSPDIITLNPSSSLEYSRTPKTRTATVAGISNFTYSYAGVSPTVYGPSGTAPTDVGAYAVTVTATSADGNYATSKTFSFGITPKTVSVTANAATKFFGSTDPVFTYAVSGLVAPDGLTGSLTRASGENVGTYNILVGTLSAGPNYTLSFTGATLTIGGAPIFSILPPASLAYDGNPKAFTAAPYQVRAIAAGPNRTLAVLMNGGVVSWGTILSGTGAQAAYTMELVPPDLTNAVAVAAGNQFSLALRSDGTIRAWGTELTPTRNQSILNPPANDSSWSGFQRPFFESYDRINEISAGTLHAVALKKRDSYDTPKTWAWGIGGDGATGKDANGYYTYSGFTNTLGYSEAFGWKNVKAIAAGYWYTLVVREDGTVQAYGDVANLAPPADLTNAIAVAAGFQHALAIRTNGTVVAWGSNLSGQTNVPAGLSGVIAVAGGRDHSLALRTNGTVVAWGGNAEGQASVPAGLTNVTAIAAGDLHSVALKSDGTVVAWGGNSSGQRNVPAALHPGTPVFTFSYAGRGTTVYGPSATPPSQGGTYTVTVTSSSSDPSMNFASTGSRDFTIEGAPLSPQSISIGPLSRDYDGTGQGVAATAPGVSGFTYSYAGVSPTVYSASSTPPTQAGSYQVTATSSDPNWSGSKTQSFAILPAALYDGSLTLTAPADLEYSGTAKEFAIGGAFLLRVTYSGIGSTDYPSSSSAPTQAGTYSVTVSTSTDDPNYERAKSAIFSITPRPVTITAQPQSKAYGAADPALTYLKSGFLGSDQPTGSLSRAAGESLGTYAIVQGTISPGPNYILQSFTGATFTISGVNSLAAGSIPFFSGVDKIMTVAPGNAYNVFMGGLAFSGENKLFVHAPSPNSSLATYQFTGTNLVISALADSARDYGQLACSGNRLFGRSGGQLYLINPGVNQSDQLVTVDPGHPLLGDGRSLFNAPDGRLGVVGEVAGAQFPVRLYTVSADGLTLTWSQDFALNDSWNPAGAGFGCDGTYFYKLSRSEGYKSYTLATGQVAHDGTDWRPPAGFNSSDNPTYMARNHLTGQFMIADTFYSRKVLVSVNLEGDSRLTAPVSLVYDGNPKSYAVAGSWLQTVYEGRGSTAYGPTTNAPVGTGTYRVKVAAKDANLNLGDLSVADFTITPATMGLGLTPPASLVYDGNPKAYTASVTNPAAGTFVYTYTGRGDTFYGPSAVAPTHVGTYSLSVTTSQASHFTDGVLNVDFAVTPATLSLAPPTSFAYSGTVKSYTTTLPFISGVTFSYSGRESTIYGPTTVAPTAPGTYRVTATVPSSGNYLISGSLTADFAITSAMVGSTPWAPLQVSSDTVLPLAGSATIVGLACDGTNYYVNRGGTAVMVYRPDGSLISSNPVSNLPANWNQMAFAGGYLFARKDSQLYRISTNDWSSSLVTRPISYPLFGGASYMTGSLFDTPDGKIGVMGPVFGGAIWVRMYTVSSNGLTLTWNRDYRVNDTWAPDEHGTACDGTFLYRMSMTTGYKAYRLATGTVAYDGTGWTKPSAIVNPTFVARNHRTGQILVGDYQGSRLIVSSASPQLGLLAPASLVFDGNPKECEVARIGSLDYTFTYRGANLTAYGPSSTAPVNAGDYLFTATSLDLAYTAPGPLAFTITRAPITLMPPTNLVYNGSGKAFSASAVGSPEIALSYQGTNGTSYGPSATAPVNAGNYFVSATALTGGANFATSVTNFTISPAAIPSDSITLTAPSNLVYSATPKACTATAVGITNFTYTYQGTNGTTYGPTTNAPSQAGSYTVLVTTPSSDPNYTGSKSLSFTVTARPLTVTANAGSKIYGASDPALTYTVSGLQGSDVLTGALSRVSGENVGTYAIQQGTLAASANYSLTYGGASLTIQPKAILGTAVTISNAAGLVYDGTAKAITATMGMQQITSIVGANNRYTALLADGTVLPFGTYPWVQPSAVTNVAQIAAGPNHMVALRRDGVVLAWGDNSYGQTNVPAGLSNVASVFVGGKDWESMSGAVLSNGTVVVWGTNSGISNWSSLSNVAAVSVGQYHYLALRKDGSVIAGGNNTYNQSVVPSGLSGVRRVRAHNNSSWAIKSNNTAVGWGSWAPPSGFTSTGIVSVDTEDSYTCAVNANGSLTGYGGAQIGMPSLTNAIDVVIHGDYYSNFTGVALKSDGTVAAWSRGSWTVPVPFGFTNTVSWSTPTYTYTGTGSTAYGPTSSAPTNVGTYLANVTAIPSGNTNYIATNSVAFTIQPAATLSTSIILTAPSLSYNGYGKAYTASAPGVTGFTYTYTGTNTTVYGPSTNAPTNVGSYVVTATALSSSNQTTYRTASFTITQSSSTSNSITLVPPASLLYDGSGKAFSALGAAGFTYSYVGTGSTTYSSSAAAPTNAGTYAVTATLVDSGYSNSSSRTEAFAIQPAPLNMGILVSFGDLVYGYDEDYSMTKPAVATAPGASGFTYSYSGTSPATGTYGPTNTAPKFWGTYDVVITASTTNPNYVSGTITNRYVITQPQVDITAHNQTKEYGAPDPGWSASGVYVDGWYWTNMIGSSANYRYAGSMTREPGEDVGTYAILAGSIQARGAYTEWTGTQSVVRDRMRNFTGATLTITPKPVTISLAAPANLTYDGTRKDFVPSATGVSSFEVSYQGVAPTSYGPSSIAPTQAGTYSMTATVGGNCLGTNSTNFTIARRPVTVVALSQSKRLGQEDPGLTYLVDGLLPGETLGGSLSRAPGNQVGTYSITQGTLGGGNYEVSFTGANLNISAVLTPGAIQLTPPTSLIYSGQGKSFSASVGNVTSFRYQYAGRNGTVYGPTYQAPAQAGDYVVTATPTDENYIGSASSDFTILPKPITVTGLVGVDREYDGTPGATVTGTAVYSGLVAGDEFSVLGTPSFSFADAQAGTHKVITVEGYVAPSANYTLGSSVLLANILPRTVTVTAEAKSKAYGEADPAWTFTNTGLLNSDSLSGSLTRASGENPGTHAITQGTLAAGANYQVVFNGAYLTIGGAPLASSAINLLGPAMLRYDGGPKSYTASSPGVSGFSLVYAGRNGTSYASSTQAPTQAGDYTVTATSTDARYSGSRSENFTISKAVLLIRAQTKSKGLQEEDPELTYQVSGLLSGDVLTGSLARAVGENVGAYSINRGTLSAGDNYTLNFVGADLTVTSASLPDAAWEVVPPSSLAYDGTAKNFTAVAGSQFTGTEFTYLYEGRNSTSYPATASAPTQAGDYRVTATATGNYTGTRQADFTITAKALTVTGLTAVSRAYDGTTEVGLSGTPGYVGLVAGEEFAVLGSVTATFADAQAGANKVVAVTGLVAPTGNYQLTDPVLSADITPRGLQVTAAAKNKEYGEEDPELTYVSSGLLGSDALTGSLARETGENAGTYAITQGSLSAGGNYTIDYVGAVFTITAAALPEPAWHVFPPLSLEYDGTAKTFMALAGGAGPSQYSSTVFTYLYVGQNGTSYDATATAPTQVGNYRLTTTASGNYTGWRQTDFAITPKLLTVSGLTAVSRAYDGTRDCSLTGTPAYDGLVGGEQFAVLGTATATFADAQAGTNKVVSVTGLVAPTGNYQVTQPSLLADITKATLVPVWSGATSVVFDGNPHALTASTTPVTSVSVTYNGSTTPPTQVGIYAVVATVLDDNYEGSESASLQILAKSVTSWAEEFGLSGADAAPSADPDGDGLNNATEFAFGTDPAGNGSSKTCEILPSSETGIIAVGFLRRISGAEASYQARVFTDLSTGFSGGTDLTPIRIVDQTGVPSGYERVKVQAPINGERGFIQIKANVP